MKSVKIFDPYTSSLEDESVILKLELNLYLLYVKSITDNTDEVKIKLYINVLIDTLFRYVVSLVEKKH